MLKRIEHDIATGESRDVPQTPFLLESGKPALLDEGAEVPEGATQITEAEYADAMRPTFNQSAAITRLRTVRAPYLNALAGMLGDAIADGNAAAVSEIRAARQVLQDLPKQPDLQTGQVSDDDTFDARVLAHIYSVKRNATPAVAAAFKDLS